MRPGLAGKAAVLAALAVLPLQACTSQPSTDKPASGSSARSAPYLGNRGYALPDSPFTRENTVVTARCGVGARYVGVVVTAWDPENWKPRATRWFNVPEDAAFNNYSGAKTVHSPLGDLCAENPDAPAPYPTDSLEHIAPRVRVLFDLSYTRMAVVLRDPGGKTASHVGFVKSDAEQNDFVRLSGATGDDEQNAVMSPDGRSVWFTYTDRSGRKRIGSRSAEGDHHLSDEGPAAGNDLPLTVTGKPARAVQANMVHLAPDGRRLTATAPKVFGTVFDTWNSSGPLSRTSARKAVLLSGCAGVVGWVGDDRVLCRTSSGSFRTMDARTGRAAGAPISVVGPQDGTVAEGMLVSPDGTKFIVSVHRPDAERDPDYGYHAPDLRVVPTTRGGTATDLADEELDLHTVFLSWS
ncbi:hypothetical protein OG887_44050 (plasmid) [Streptomyces sp. NBC_00053]|uniref:hypothetical protein n=1 Tax=unclassified Streptomyces TaxID=2593676 RepID=UPI002255A537|nr:MULTISPECIES: hypothetical protein [unclassified Streptomyces]MCX4400025.1 hypothetical protein [Streptomyces sp. NBC_01767]MCX5505976.1 hypothetical protein [Streptomyces sp. NBC_00052]MCX5554025.1 hypothetical protein [Streptomyces sp. NBC_00051]MCX5554371.1 hypothetical protein [Streptomyces sp. NBC_00051]